MVINLCLDSCGHRSLIEHLRNVMAVSIACEGPVRLCVLLKKLKGLTKDYFLTRKQQYGGSKMTFNQRKLTCPMY